MPSVSELLVRIDATTEGLRRELANADRSLSTFSNNTTRQLSKVDQSFAKVGTGVTGIHGVLGKLQSSFDTSFASMAGNIRNVTGLLGGLGVAMGASEVLRGFVAMSDAATTMQNRLKSVTGSAAELASAQDLLYESSQANSIETSTNVELFARLSRALQGTGADTERVVEMVDTLGKVVRLSGANVQEASGALLQFSQAMNSGKLNGEEFRSIAENLPMLLTAIAQEVATLNGISLEQAKAELKSMAEEGTLTTEIITNATESMRKRVVDDFDELDSTTAGATTRMWNALTRLAGKFDDMAGVSSGLVSKIDSVTSAFDFGVGALDRYGGSLSTLLGWINSIPHPLSLLAQAAAGAAAQVAQAAGEITAAMNKAGAAKSSMLSMGEGGGGGLGGMAARLGMSAMSGGGGKGVTIPIMSIDSRVKEIKKLTAAKQSPIANDPMAVAGLATGNVDFTKFGGDLISGPTGVTKDRPKLKFFKGPSTDEKKASKAIQKEEDDLLKSDLRAVEGIRRETMTARDKYQARVAELDDLVARQALPEELYKKAIASAGEDYNKAIAPRGGGGGGGGKKTSGGATKRTTVRGGKSDQDRERDRDQERAVSEGKSVFNETRTDAEAYGAEISRLDELLARNAITQETHARAVAAATLEMEKSRSGFQGSQEAAQAYLDEVSRLQGLLSTGVIGQDEYNARILQAQEKYGNAKSGAAAYAAEVTRLDEALAAGAISEQEHAASLSVARTAMNEGLEEAARLWEETRTPLERYNEELRQLSELWASGAISDDTRMRAAVQLWEDLRDELEETNASMKAAKALGDDLGMAFASSFEDAIIKGGKLRDIMKGLWEDIQRIVVRQMVTVPLATGLSSILTGVTGAMMGGGGAALPPMPGTPGGGFAAGGPVKGPGSGTSDSIPAIMPGGGLARLSNGEFIVNSRSAAKHERLLRAINNDSFTRAFATGGPVGNLHAAGGSRSGPIQITLENKSPHPLKTEGAKSEGPGPDGKTMIRVMVVDAVKSALAGGELDRGMGARYGATVQPIGR